jgi:hypothetical protein
MPAFLSNLGIIISVSLCKHTGDFTDISEAISFQQKAVQLTPDVHAKMPSFLNNLGGLFVSRFRMHRRSH